MEQAQMAERTETFNMRLSEEEARQFERVASHYGLPVASMLRMLVREKDLEISRDEQFLKSGKIAPKEATRFARMRARAKTEEETGASFAFPTFLQAQFREAARGGAVGYEALGYVAAMRVFRSELEGAGDAAQAALAKLLEDQSVNVSDWVRRHFPRIFEAVPAKRREAFARGINRALEEGEV